MEADRVIHHLPEDCAATEGLTDLMAAVWAADCALITDNHAAALDSAAPELLANVPGGMVIDRTMLGHALALNMITYSRYERWVERAFRRPNGEFVLMGAEEVTPKAENQRLQGGLERRRFTEVWREDAGRWLLALRHAG